MKRFLSFLLSVVMVITSTVFVAGAVTTVNPAIRISDTTGFDGYSAATDDINAKVQSEGGVTVVMDVLVESFTTPTEGMFSQIAAFTGGDSAKYNLLSYDFTDAQFKAGQSANWISSDQADYAAVQTNPFSWDTGVWYELAFRFNGTKAAVYLNGICVISTEFDSVLTDYIIVYPQFCTARFDNIRICAKDYNVAEGTGTVWATEDFSDLSAANESAVWYSEFEISDLGCNGVVTSATDKCISINDTDGQAGYSAAHDTYNEKVAAEGGVTLIADVFVNSYTEAPEGYFSQIVAFSGAYSATDRYNYTGYDFSAGAFKAREGGAWISNSQTDMYTELDSNTQTLETGVWYEMAWQFNGNVAKMYLDGTEVLSTQFSSVDNGYIILYPQYCDVKIDNIRLCDKEYDVANGVGTVWAAEDYSTAVSYDTSDVWYVDSGYKLVGTGTDAFMAGDVNDDGSVDSTDYATMNRIVAGVSVKYGSGADVDMNGAINTQDVSLLARIIKGYNYSPDFSLDVIPVENDNSAIVDEENGGGETTEPDIPEEPDDTTSTEPEEPDEPISTETFVDGLDGSTLKFDGQTASSYTFLHREGGINYDDVALSFDVLVSEIDSSVDFAGLGVWNGDNFVGYDFKDQAFVSDSIGYSYAPSTNGKAFSLNIGEWNHFNFRRINNDTFHVYVNGVKQLELTGQSYANTFFLFGFKGCTAYVDNYQYYDAGTGKGLIDDFSTFTTDGTMLKSSDGGYWLIGSQGLGGVCTNVVAGDTGSGISGTDAAAGETIKPEESTTVTEPPVTSTEPPVTSTKPPVTSTEPPVTQPPVTTATPYDPNAPVDNGSGDTSKIDSSVLKFDGIKAASYTFLFSYLGQSYDDMALTFDVFVESVDESQAFAGLGVWNANYADNLNKVSGFVGYNFNTKRFTNDTTMGYPSVPESDNGPALNLKVGEWNHFCLRRLDNDTFRIYVNGTLYFEVTGQDYANTFYLFGFKNCVAYVDNYQYYHAGTPCGLVTDFTTGATTDSEGFTKFSDGGYWVVGSQGFAGVVSGGSGSGDSGSGDSGGNSGENVTLQKLLTNIQNSGNITSAKKEACKVVAQELFNLGYETAFIAGVLGNLCHEGNTGIFEYYNTNTDYHPNFNSYLGTYYGTTYKSMFSGKFVYNMNLATVYNIFTDLNNMNWKYNGVRIGAGVGCIQWTFGRSYTLIKIYREVTGNGSSITKEQALAAEGLMVSRELNGSYKSVYNTWKNNNSSNMNSQTAAYNAAYDVCVKYERPSDMYNKAVTRGNFAQLVYNDLIK